MQIGALLFLVLKPHFPGCQAELHTHTLKGRQGSRTVVSTLRGYNYLFCPAAIVVLVVVAL